jgi:hypothetical protein
MVLILNGNKGRVYSFAGQFKPDRIRFQLSPPLVDLSL